MWVLCETLCGGAAILKAIEQSKPMRRILLYRSQIMAINVPQFSRQRRHL